MCVCVCVLCVGVCVCVLCVCVLCVCVCVCMCAEMCYRAACSLSLCLSHGMVSMVTQGRRLKLQWLFT